MADKVTDVAPIKPTAQAPVNASGKPAPKAPLVAIEPSAAAAEKAYAEASAKIEVPAKIEAPAKAERQAEKPAEPEALSLPALKVGAAKATPMPIEPAPAAPVVDLPRDMAPSPKPVVAKAPVKAPPAKAPAAKPVAPAKAAPARLAPARDLPVKPRTAKAKPVPVTKPAAVAAPAVKPSVPAVLSAKIAPPAPALPLTKTPKPAAALVPVASKEKSIMAIKTEELTSKITDAVKGASERAKAALEKSQASVGEIGEFTKGNVEAMVESTKILASGIQTMGKSYVAETKTAFEAMTADVKELATAKTPTEFFEKQSAMLRKNFESAVANSSKSSEAMLKLVNEAFQPISNRVSLAIEKVKKAA